MPAQDTVSTIADRTGVAGLEGSLERKTLAVPVLGPPA